MEGQRQNNTLEFDIHFGKGRNGRKQIRVGRASEKPEQSEGRIPRISRLMALAVKMDGMIQRGEVKDYVELALLGHVSRARITQIMNLLILAPDIQEEILFLPRVQKGRDVIRERRIKGILREARWEKQRVLWRQLNGD